MQNSHEMCKIRLKLPNSAVGHNKKVKGHKTKFDQFDWSCCYLLSTRKMAVLLVYSHLQKYLASVETEDALFDL